MSRRTDITYGNFIVIDATGAIVRRSVGGYHVAGDQLVSTFSIPEASDTGEDDPGLELDARVVADGVETRRFIDTCSAMRR